MAGKVAPYAKKQILNELFGNTNQLNFGTVYLGACLASSVPAVNSSEYYGGFVEPNSADGCGREVVGDYSQSALQYFKTLTSDGEGAVTIANSKEIKFDTYRGASAISIKYIALFNGSTSTSALMYFELASPITLNPNELLVIPVGQATCKMA